MGSAAQMDAHVRGAACGAMLGRKAAGEPRSDDETYQGMMYMPSWKASEWANLDLHLDAGVLSGVSYLPGKGLGKTAGLSRNFESAPWPATACMHAKGCGAFEGNRWQHILMHQVQSCFTR